MKSSHSHVHRKYFGEATAHAVLEWLNTPKRKSHRIEKMVAAFADLESRTNEFAAVKTIQAILRESKLRLQPWWSQPMVKSPTKSPFRPGVYRWKLDRSHSIIEWDPISPRMNRAEALALHKLLDLASQGLINHVRMCARQECGKWFFVRFAQHEYCSTHCQQKQVRSTDDWKEKRREYMRRHRHDEKMRLQKEFESLKSKRKAAKR